MNTPPVAAPMMTARYGNFGSRRESGISSAMSMMLSNAASP